MYMYDKELTTWARLFKRNVVTNLALIYLGVKSFSLSQVDLTPR
jgi:hypothetical protein